MRGRAVRFVVLLGLVSLFADMTYEGARSVAGPFLGLLGASGAAVGVVAGLGEFVGYGFRLVSGVLADRSRRYWMLTFVGYAVNLLAVPLLALAGRWEVAAALMVLERTGKALRTPARDVMLSHATSRLGRGVGFGLHEAMDQVGAVVGPAMAASVLALRGDYGQVFGWLGVPAVLALGTLVAARLHSPDPSALEGGEVRIGRRGFGRPFWTYLAAASLVAVGFADFPLVAFRLQRDQVVGAAALPALYAVAMGVDAVAALVLGRMYDRAGAGVLAAASLVSAAAAPLLFLADGLGAVVAGMVAWGVGMGAQESVLRAVVADLVPAGRRGTAYGLFHTVFGAAWFAGSAALGVLLDVSAGGLVAVSITAQVAAVPIFLRLRRRS